MRGWSVLGVAVVIAGCGEVTVPDAPDAEQPPPPDVPLPPASCNALRMSDPALPSGDYEIDPDGLGGAEPLAVACDMVTDGGGWTIVFLATPNLPSVPVRYTAVSPRLMTDAKEALLAYRNAAMMSHPDHARFSLLMDWRSMPPLNFRGTDRTISVSVNGAAPITATLRYGRDNFEDQLCSHSWAAPNGEPYGRICITGTRAPYFSGFARGDGDYCTHSQSHYNATPCGDDLRFSIAVR